MDEYLAAQLKPHQVEGVHTLFRRLGGGRNGHGAVLGDGMGLGKTVQAITLMHTLLANKLASSALVLVPSGLLATWRRELAKWLAGAAAPIRWAVVGDEAQDGGVTAALERLRCAQRGSPCVLVLSYDRFWRADTFVGGGGRVDLLICDEAHELDLDAPTAQSRLLQSLATGTASATDEAEEEALTPAQVSMFGKLAFGGDGSSSTSWLPLCPVREEMEVEGGASLVQTLPAGGLVKYMLHASELQWTS